MSELATVEVVAHGDGEEVVRVRGEVDLSNATLVGDQLSAAVAEATVVIVDLSETTYLDSAGIAMLFRFDERLKHARHELRLVVPPDSPIRGVVRMTRLDQVIPVQDTLG